MTYVASSQPSFSNAGVLTFEPRCAREPGCAREHARARASPVPELFPVQVTGKIWNSSTTCAETVAMTFNPIRPPHVYIRELTCTLCVHVDCILSTLFAGY